MKQDDPIKKQVQVLGLVVVVLLFGGESFLLGKMPNLIRSAKSRISSLEGEKSRLEALQRDKKALEMELEEIRPIWQRLFEKFPNSEDTENRINATLTRITSGMIVISDKLRPKQMSDYIARDLPDTSVPKILDADRDSSVLRMVEVASYESDFSVRCNYFEMLEFLHEVGNQEIFFTPLDLKIEPDPEAPYGVTGRFRLLTFGFGQMKEDKF